VFYINPCNVYVFIADTTGTAASVITAPGSSQTAGALSQTFSTQTTSTLTTGILSSCWYSYIDF